MKQPRARGLDPRLYQRFAPGGFLHSARASGIPARACRAGRFRCIGARTAADLGRARADRDARGERQRQGRRRRALAGEFATRLGLEPDYVIPAYEDAPYWLLKNRRCRSTSTRSTRRSTTRRSARAWCARSTTACRARPASCCRCSAGTPRPSAPGAASAGRCGAASCSCPRRLAGRPPAADEDPALCRAEGLPLPIRTGPAGAARAPARADPVSPVDNAPPRRRCAGAERAVRRRRRGAHRAVRRAARRRALRVHAAAPEARGLSRAARHGRGDRARRAARRCGSRATRRRTIRAST